MGVMNCGGFRFAQLLHDQATNNNLKCFDPSIMDLKLWIEEICGHLQST